jgi:hypothetical protein
MTINTYLTAANQKVLARGQIENIVEIKNRKISFLKERNPSYTLPKLAVW